MCMMDSVHVTDLISFDQCNNIDHTLDVTSFIQMVVPFSVALVRSMMILLNAANALQDSPSMITNASVSAILTADI